MLVVYLVLYYLAAAAAVVDSGPFLLVTTWVQIVPSYSVHLVSNLSPVTLANRRCVGDTKLNKRTIFMRSHNRVFTAPQALTHFWSPCGAPTKIFCLPNAVSTLLPYRPTVNC